MLVGDKNTFAIEWHPDPQCKPGRCVFGRMCLWASGVALGDIDEPACMLNVSQAFLRDVLARLDALDDASLSGLDPRAAFDFLDQKLYLDMERSSAQMAADSLRFSRFDFLTNGGESFDRTKSFLVRAGDVLTLLFRDANDVFHSAHVPVATFIEAVRGFLDGMDCLNPS